MYTPGYGDQVPVNETDIAHALQGQRRNRHVFNQLQIIPGFTSCIHNTFEIGLFCSKMIDYR